MKSRSKIICSVLLLSLFAPVFNIFAFETDQYNLPTVPLADIGDEVSEYVEGHIQKAFEKLNEKIVRSEACLANRAKDCDSAEKETAKLAELRSEDELVEAVFRPLGGGVPPFTNSGSFMEKHDFTAQPARFKASFSDSIYQGVPTSYFTISDTVRIYGYEFGTDKIAHIFQQGFTYYKMYEKAIAKGLPPEDAAQKAIKYGKKTEATYYGYLVSGVYSNGDLAANYAGMKFYQNLLHETKIGDETLPPILKLVEGRWKFNENIVPRDAVLKPFVSNHFNEAHNPSVYFKLFWLDSSVRKTVKKQSCPGWRNQFPEMKKADFEEITSGLKLWHGEDYGHKESKRFITIANSCFESDKADGKTK
jgi:hypothetical protein